MLERPPSPCIQICTLDEDKVCRGCERTLEEISRWALLSPAEQWGIIERIRDQMSSTEMGE